MRNQDNERRPGRRKGFDVSLRVSVRSTVPVRSRDEALAGPAPTSRWRKLLTLVGVTSLTTLVKTAIEAILDALRNRFYSPLLTWPWATDDVF